ncbi:hypothetical protein [Streptomyces sp. CRN 30]|uniref:hypothetical protein n=1 Tax=Streptomyces sp. CRN 30 TaxID=3075613 RepID=UPI002A825778|nr:hypothetical protein [Streptomyces sp. CRN 30]
MPHPQHTAPYARRSYWSIPMDGPGTLGSPEAVAQLIAASRFQQSATDGTAGI